MSEMERTVKAALEWHVRVRGNSGSGKCRCGFNWDDENDEGFYDEHRAQMVLEALESAALVEAVACPFCDGSGKIQRQAST